MHEYVKPYLPWIETVLGMSFGDTVTLELETFLLEAVSVDFLKGVQIDRLVTENVSDTMKLVKRWELPPGSSPRINMCPVRERNTDATTSWIPGWLECPVAIWLHEVSTPAIVVHVPYTSFAKGLTSDWKYWIICPRASLGKLLEVLANACFTSQRRVTVIGGYTQVLEADSDPWEGLVLDPEVDRLVRNDFENFFAREDWFRKHRLPFKRGYLFYGPPGNGKTSVIRAMASRPGLSLFSVNFNSEEVSDKEIMKLLDQASLRAPSLVILEDMDRILPMDTGGLPKTKVSLSGLLNSLDGLALNQGVIIVATANDCSQLDPAIINRPGRFDRMIEFNNPSSTVRISYLQKVAALDDEDAGHLAAATDGFSFAQMKELYVLAGQLAFEEERDISISDLQRATEIMRELSIKSRSASSAKVGFQVHSRALVD